MEAGDGALTPDRSPAPSRDANRSPAVPQRWPQRIVMFQTGVSRIPMLPMKTRRASRPTRSLASGRNAPNLMPSASFRPDRSSRKGSLPSWEETATRRLQSGRPEPGPGSAGMCHFSVHRGSSRQPMLSPIQTEISALDCQKNIAYFLTHDDDVRLRSRSGHEACPCKRTRQRVHAARLPRLGRPCCG